ncbi:TetR/AcrR family transcriptional regulator [Candidatus Nitrotoga sp. M5]|uniref:TetR/AcrR family transcriptional regulator n=1 Tax=Candidatus Nitrotoga sp. M5 TaxID=2890409 RepID=UPI001EF6FE83|nr:TetR/AcrR family transcriptional regulator [Candidatus Nitrotoga sp. M5]CAH1387497.1 HTH tetR-type domain-containing protein [Candidatus Nitrotoga sp. M5]
MKPTIQEQTRSQQSDKRKQILSIATKIFFREGYGRASMDKVHSELGGSKRTLYNYFPSKEALFEAIVTQVSDQVLTALRPPLGDADLRTTLVKMGNDYLGVLLSPVGISLYRAMVSEAPHFPELAHTFFENGPSRSSHHLAAFFRDQNAQGLIEVSDPQIAAEHFLGAVRGDIHLAAVLTAKRPSKQMVEAAVAQTVRTFLDGVNPKL